MLLEDKIWVAQGQNPCYLLLNQAQEENIPLILERLGESGYSMQVVTPQEELALACLPKEADA